MDKDKLRKLIISTWKDGNSQFHDLKGSIDYDADLEVWFDTIEDDINELCGGECSNENSGLHLQRVRLSLIAYEEAKHSFLPPKYRKETATNIVNHVLGNLWCITNGCMLRSLLLREINLKKQ